jgi:hypothetical protein
MYRNEEIDKTQFVVGTTERADPGEELSEFYSGRIEEGEIEIIDTPLDIYVALMEGLKKSCSFAIADDYKFWQDSERASEYGKMLLIDQTDYFTQHIFFDDNNDPDSDCIVDVRDLISGEIIAYKKAINKYIVKVEPERAILERDYFLEMINVCEKRRSEEIDRIEQGLSTEDETLKEEEENEWENLQSAPSDEYLTRTVLPVLYQGMKLIDIERPQDPFASLAFYLLKHQDDVKIPEYVPPPPILTQHSEEERKDLTNRSVSVSEEKKE